MTTYEERTKSLLEAVHSASRENLLGAIIEHDPKFYFKDGVVISMVAKGLPVLASMRDWATSYKGSNAFVQDVARKLSGGKLPTERQARALLNVAMKEAQEKAPASSVTASPSTMAEPTPELKHKCFVCDERFATISEAASHRVRAHKGAASLEPDAPKRPVEDWKLKPRNCKACDFVGTWDELREHRKEHYKPLFDGVPQSGLDLSSLPMGRYAVPDLSGTDYIFLSVARVNKTKERSKKFRFGWVTYGSEMVQEGTLEVRRWRGETKELIGEQRPGETYRGDYLDEWKLILQDPVASTKLFGVIHERCGRCGTSLTDPESRKRAIGPECIKHYRDPRVLADAGSKEDLTSHFVRLRGETTPAAFLKKPAAPPPSEPAPSPFTVVGAGSVIPEFEGVWIEVTPEPEPAPKKILAPPGW